MTSAVRWWLINYQLCVCYPQTSVAMYLLTITGMLYTKPYSLKIRLSAVTFHGMVNNAMVAKLPTTEEVRYAFHKNCLLLKAMMFNMIVDNVAVNKCKPHHAFLWPHCPRRLAGHGLHG